MTPRSLTPLSGGIVTGTVSIRAGPVRASASAIRRFPACFGEPLYPAGCYTGAPRAGTPHRHLGSRGPGSFRQTTHIPSVGAAALDRCVPLQIHASRRSIVSYDDRTLNCVDCGVEFIHSAADQEFYVQKGFVSDPKRCTSCRASRRASRDGGYDVRDIGGPRGYERGDDRPQREYFAVICSSCGNQAQVPFKPRMDRPVYCSDCFRTVKPG